MILFVDSKFVFLDCKGQMEKGQIEWLVLLISRQIYDGGSDKIDERDKYIWEELGTSENFANKIGCKH